MPFFGLLLVLFFVLLCSCLCLLIGWHSDGIFHCLMPSLSGRLVQLVVGVTRGHKFNGRALGIGRTSPLKIRAQNKKEKFKTGASCALDIHGIKQCTNFQGSLTSHWLKLLDASEFWDQFFGDFPIQMAENARKRPNFVASYLGNRWELRGQ